MLRSVILAAARSPKVENLVESTSVSRAVVRRYVAGTELPDVLAVTADLIAEGLTVSLDHLGEDVTDAESAVATKDAYIGLLRALAEQRYTPAAEVSVKLSAVGQALDRGLALDNARAICQAAVNAGTTVTLDAEDHTTTDSTLDILHDLRKDFPSTGVVVQSYLRRTEGDCKDLAVSGSRVRLCKGAYSEPETVAFGTPHEVDRSYVRCLNVLMSGQGYPMVATHDPRLIAIADERAKWYDRAQDSYEFQMLYGVRPDEQRRLANQGNTVRIYVPYGAQWYGYLMRRLAERPANVAFFLRSLVSKR